ncbi:MAG: nucleoside monophosphate kinase [Legionellaceae bacterium]|nr:nucleoside monophosphate kinase [Legionellaceae bacterium]
MFSKNSLQARGFFSYLSPKPKTAVLLLGPPCAGKSTQLKSLMEKNPGVMCISTGDLVRKLDKKIRDAQQPLNEIERLAAHSLDEMRCGKLMDDDAVYALLMAYISSGGEGHEAYLQADMVILDGVIKAQRNLLPFDRALQTFNTRAAVKFVLEKVIVLQASEEDLISRFQTRITSAMQMGQAQRPDDELEIYQRRLNSYMEECEKILNHYREILPVIEIDSSEGIEPTSQQLLGALELPHSPLSRSIP